MIITAPNDKSIRIFIRSFFAILGLVLALDLYGVGVIGVGYYESHLDGPATTMLNSKIRGPAIFHEGDSIGVEFDTTRYKSCKLEVDRIIKRIDRASIMGDQDHVVDHVTQIFVGDGITRKSFYYADLPNKLNPGKYVIYSSGIYTCNAADKLFSHTIVTDEVPFEIVPKNVPIAP